MKHHTTPETFGVRLARLREAKKMTRAELAEAAGVSRNMVYRWETGSRGAAIPLPTLRTLATALGVDLATLAGEE